MKVILECHLSDDELQVVMRHVAGQIEFATARGDDREWTLSDTLRSLLNRAIHQERTWQQTCTMLSSTRKQIRDTLAVLEDAQ